MIISYYVRYFVVVSLNTYLLTIYNIKAICFSLYFSNNQIYETPKYLVLQNSLLIF